MAGIVAPIPRVAGNTTPTAIENLAAKDSIPPCESPVQAWENETYNPSTACRRKGRSAAHIPIHNSTAA